MKGYIYKITNNINGKVYIGQTIRSLQERLNEHIAAKSVIGYAIRKYGKDNFRIELLEEVEIDKIDEREIYWIEFFNSTNKHEGYNISTGGAGVHGYHHSDVTKQVISEYSKGRRALYKDGITRYVKDSEYHKLIEEGWTPGVIRKEVSPCVETERVRKISEALRNRLWYTNGQKTVRISPEQEEEYIQKGYVKGLLKEGQVMYRVYMNNGQREQDISNNKIQLYLSRGWTLGRLSDFDAQELLKIYEHYVQTVEHNRKEGSITGGKTRLGHVTSEETKRKLSLINKGKHLSSETRLKISERNKQRVYQPMSNVQKELLSNKMGNRCIVNNGVIETLIPLSELHIYEEQGYVRGHIRSKQTTKGSVWINNGSLNKRVSKENVQQYLNEGYVKGRL